MSEMSGTDPVADGDFVEQLQPDDTLRVRDPARLPPFPEAIVAEAGGAPLDAAGIRAQIEAARGQSHP